MKLCLAIALSALALPAAIASAQDSNDPQSNPQMAYNAPAPPPAARALPPVSLEWTPPALAQLSAQATMKENFTLDRNMLELAAGVMGDNDQDDRNAIRKLDGVSVHTMRFGDNGVLEENALDSIRAAYHVRGWKHLVTTSQSGGAVRNNTTDVWIVMDGMNLRGAVVLATTPRSLTLVTVAGNLSPVDLLHLRGHFGIPRFDSNSFHDPQVQ